MHRTVRCKQEAFLMQSGDKNCSQKEKACVMLHRC
ncbi:hypothetical protein Paride_0373 [Pseudomonas phage Paride]|nr:hypothetical protein Paride_0373 [Pseudomonas phage Paride]